VSALILNSHTKVIQINIKTSIKFNILLLIIIISYLLKMMVFVNKSLKCFGLLLMIIEYFSGFIKKTYFINNTIL